MIGHSGIGVYIDKKSSFLFVDTCVSYVWICLGGLFVYTCIEIWSAEKKYYVNLDVGFP